MRLLMILLITLACSSQLKANPDVFRLGLLFSSGMPVSVGSLPPAFKKRAVLGGGVDMQLPLGKKFIIGIILQTQNYHFVNTVDKKIISLYDEANNYISGVDISDNSIEIAVPTFQVGYRMHFHRFELMPFLRVGYFGGESNSVSRVTRKRKNENYFEELLLTASIRSDNIFYPTAGGHISYEIPKLFAVSAGLNASYMKHRILVDGEGHDIYNNDLSGVVLDFSQHIVLIQAEVGVHYRFSKLKKSPKL